MTWVRGETYQFIHSRKVRTGINNSVLKCIEYRFYLVFEGILFNEIESCELGPRPLLGTNESAEYKFQSPERRELPWPGYQQTGGLIPGYLIIRSEG